MSDNNQEKVDKEQQTIENLYTQLHETLQELGVLHSKVHAIYDLSLLVDRRVIKGFRYSMLMVYYLFSPFRLILNILQLLFHPRSTILHVAHNMSPRLMRILDKIPPLRWGGKHLAFLAEQPFKIWSILYYFLILALFIRGSIVSRLQKIGLIKNKQGSPQKENRLAPGSPSPVNYHKRDFTPESIQSDLEYAVSIGQNYLKWFSTQSIDLHDKLVLEIGPGINFGSTLLLACYGANVIVADRFITPWDNDYHPKVYTGLCDWITENLPEADTSPIQRVVAAGGYQPDLIRCVENSLEDLSEIQDASVDIVVSNAVFEHLNTPKVAFHSLARISKPGAFGFHQVDFRDHRNFDKPLEYLLMDDSEFSKMFDEQFGECGNRFRPWEYEELFEEVGFEILEFNVNSIASEKYLDKFVHRLKLKGISKYQNVDPAALKKVGGCYHLKKTL